MTELKVGDKVRLAPGAAILDDQGNPVAHNDKIMARIGSMIGTVTYIYTSEAFFLPYCVTFGHSRSKEECWDFPAAYLLTEKQSANFDTFVAAVADLYHRFGLVPHHADTRNVLEEEYTEFKDAADELLYAQATYPERDSFVHRRRKLAAEELADLVFTGVGHALACGVTEAQIKESFQTIQSKNNAKTTETHTVVKLDNGANKIQRIGRS